MRSFDRIHLELLVLEAQRGDVAAFEELLRAWLPVLTRHAYRLTGDREGAAEMTQEACLAITRGLRRLDDPARFESWTLRIVTKKAADWVMVAPRCAPPAPIIEAESFAFRICRDAIAGRRASFRVSSPPVSSVLIL